VQRDGQDVARRRFDVLPVQCAARLDALALAIAVALEHLAQAEPSAFEPGPVRAAGAPNTIAPASAPDSSTPPSPPAAATPAAETRELDDEAAQPSTGTTTPIRYALLAHAAIWLDALPETAGAFGLGLELGLGPTRWSAVALASTETDVALADGRARARFFGGRAQACLPRTLIAPDLQAEPCAGMIAGAVLADGQGFPVERSATLPYLAPLVRLSLRYPAHSLLSLRLAVDGLFNVVRPELQVTGASRASDSSAAFGLAPSVELLVELP
jgi:hypothetical protein